MSAIAGVWRFGGGGSPADDCARMLAAQQIYGPHDGRHWCEGPLAMGRRLFRTLPEDIHDRQPLRSRDGRLTLVADVRLDNRNELTAELGLVAAGQLCDAAILLATLERWGEGAFAKLVGDFAFAVWDTAAQRLLLARDFLGQRPLFYHHGRGFFAFASMPKGLHALAEIPYGPDEQAVAEFLVLMPQQTTRSFFKTIARVPLGHVVTVTRDSVSSRCFWQPRRPGRTRMRPGEYIEELRRHLDQAVESRLRGANGIVGSHLSAGLDSGAVTATAARLLASRGGKVVAFTAVPRAGYEGPAPETRFADEGPLAAATAALYPNIEHVLIRSGRQSPVEDLDREFYLCERPPLNLCNNVWLSAIERAARDRKLTVMLTGSIGNITMSYYGISLLTELLLKCRLIRLWREAAHLVDKAGVSPRGALILIFGPLLPIWLWRWVQRRVGRPIAGVLEYSAIRADHFAKFNLAALARERDLDFSFRPWIDGFRLRVWGMTRLDLAEANKGALAGWGLDYRDPSADKRLVEFCLSVPTDQYLADGEPRALARRAFSDRLPSTVLSARKRGYQAADWHEGLTAARADVAAELDRLAGCAPAARAIDLGRLKRLVEDWPTSGWERDDIEDGYRLALLRGISAGHFLRKASGAN